MGVDTVLTRSLKLAHPIIQAPLAGGGNTPDLVAAVSNGGALGFIGAAYLTPEQIIATAAAVRARTSWPFGINLFAPLPPSESRGRPETMLARLAPYFIELGLPAPSLPKSEASMFDRNSPLLSKAVPPCLALPSVNCPPAPWKRLRPVPCS
ncbi:MAG TPA: nitronate monooxygenase [Terriglobales bacterium]|nr:nitronate monooxygenase [Terriglobales bacterium]